MKAEDLQPRRPVTVTIDRAVVEDIRQRDGTKEPRVVIAFRGKTKRLICNMTQAMTLADIAKTEEFTRWSGLTVVLTPGRTQSGQATILIRRQAAQGEPPSPVVDTVDNPFEDEQ